MVEIKCVLLVAPILIPCLEVAIQVREIQGCLLLLFDEAGLYQVVTTSFHLSLWSVVLRLICSSVRRSEQMCVCGSGYMLSIGL